MRALITHQGLLITDSLVGKSDSHAESSCLDEDISALLQAENVAKKQAASKRAAAATAAGPDAKPGKRKKAWWEEELEDVDKRKRMRDTTEEDAQYYREEVASLKAALYFGSTYVNSSPCLEMSKINT